MTNDNHRAKLQRWDTYFHTICSAVASKSPCKSRQIGAILVRDNSIVATGFNGPPRNYPHCEGECNRRRLGYKSGEGLHLCPAAHAEVNCISNAARLGVSVRGTTLYMNCISPCKDCMIQIVNAGIIEIVVNSLDWYHDMSKAILLNSRVEIRKFYFGGEY